jgi:hypothetical protein
MSALCLIHSWISSNDVASNSWGVANIWSVGFCGLDISVFDSHWEGSGESYKSSLRV